MAASPHRNDVLEALATGRTRTQVAADLGMSYWQVTRIARGGGIGRPTPPAERAEAWEPLCMDPDEWASWQATNRGLNHGNQAPLPCYDCLAGYAADMRALGRCNGQPAGDHHDEEEKMPATDIQRAAWTAYHRLGSQSAAGRDLGITQGGIRSALIGYMKAEGIEGYIPTPDPSLIAGSSESQANGPESPANAFVASTSGSLVPAPEPIVETLSPATSDPHLTDDPADGHDMTTLAVDPSADHSETIPVADPFALINAELDRLAAEDDALIDQAAAIVRARTDVAARIERIRAAAQVIRELSERAA